MVNTQLETKLPNDMINWVIISKELKRSNVDCSNKWGEIVVRTNSNSSSLQRLIKVIQMIIDLFENHYHYHECIIYIT